MDSCLVVFVALLTFAVCYSNAAWPGTEVSKLQLQAHQEFKRFVDSFIDGNGSPQMSDEFKRKGTFSYENCAAPSKEVVIVSSLDIQPDPIKLPGKVNVSFESVIKRKFGAPLTAHLKVEKKFFGVWITIPCIFGVGSCTYDNACEMLAQKVKTCPPALVKQGLNCTCPVSPTKVSLKNYTLPVDIKAPVGASGSIRVKMELTSGKTYITCLQMTMKLD